MKKKTMPKKIATNSDAPKPAPVVRLQVEASRATRQASFRIEHSLLVAFQDKCSSSSLSQARVIEGMMRAFVDGSIVP